MIGGIDDPRGPTREENEQLVRALQSLMLENWQALAALAWQGYQRRGRGAVLINVDVWATILQVPEAHRPDINVEYATAEDAVFDEILSEMLDHDQLATVTRALQVTLATYDPRQEIAVFGYSPEDYHFLFTVEGEPPPPDCLIPS